MARRKSPSETPVGSGTPAQQDEADIVAEIGATPVDDGSGELQANEAKVREAGAVDAESIIENRRVQEIVDKKRGGQTGVLFNSDNLLEKYEGIIKYWPANTLDILVKRVTGTPVEWVVQSRPRSGGELYAAIAARHGHYEEAEYDVRFRDVSDKQRRGTGRIVMPDTRDTPPTMQQQPPGQQPMNPYNPVPIAVQAAAPSADPVAMMKAMFDMFRQMQPQQQAAQPPPVMVTQPLSQPSSPSTDPVAMMKTVFEMIQQMQAPAQAVPQPQLQPQPQPLPTSADPVAMMRAMGEMFQQTQQPQAVTSFAPSQPTPPSADPLVMMRSMFEMFRQMQPAQSAPVAPAQQQPQPSSVPPVQAPPGMFHVPGFGFVPAERLFQVLSGAPASGPEARPGPYRGPYQRQQEEPRYPPQDPRYPPSQQQRPKTAAEEFKDAASVIDMAMNLADRFRPPQASTASEPDRARYDEDNPVKVVNVGDFPIVINKEDGSTRKWETGVALLPNLLKWIAEQREASQKAQTDRETKQQRQQQPLPPGYVEVGPGYRPPPGYVAVPIGMGQGLPPPPENMPPPISQSEEQSRPQRQWGAPPMPGDG